jgi:hypothetical protein
MSLPLFIERRLLCAVQNGRQADPPQSRNHRCVRGQAQTCCGKVLSTAAYCFLVTYIARYLASPWPATNRVIRRYCSATAKNISRQGEHDWPFIFALDVAGKNLQPPWFEQRHAHDVLAFVGYADVVEKNSFQFETKSAVQIDIAHVDVA